MPAGWDARPAAGSILISLSEPIQPATSAASQPERHAIFYFVLAILFGALAGFAEVKVGDLLLTAFLVLAPTMFLGTVRPARPWRWALLVSTCVPLARILAAFVLHQYTERPQIYESFLVFLPGVVGAYGGHFMRLFVENVMRKNTP